MSKQNLSDLEVNEKDGCYDFSRSVTKQEIVDTALWLQLSDLNKNTHLDGSKEVSNYLQLHLTEQEREVFTVIFLNVRHVVISCQDMFFGTINNAVVHPREIVKESLKQNAASVILAHNHPSGIPEPSAADCTLTSRIKEALEMVDIKLLDHFIIGAGKSVSFAERGLI